MSLDQVLMNQSIPSGSDVAARTSCELIQLIGSFVMVGEFREHQRSEPARDRARRDLDSEPSTGKLMPVTYKQ
jgi:hypothetical protein